MITAIIIDDERHAVESLKYELQNNCPEVQVIASTTKAKEGIELIKKLNPDLLFLDIEMPWMSGFELLQKVENLDFEVIFVTAYDQYAIKAFKFSAIDYLLKPVDGEDLKAAVDKMAKRSIPFNANHLDTLIQNLSQKDNLPEKIVLPTSNGLEFVKVSKIIRCQSDNNYCTIYLTGKRKIFLAKTLKEIESLLVDYPFIRIHNSHLIAEKYISKYNNMDGGMIEMTDGSKIPISRSKKVDFLNRFKG